MKKKASNFKRLSFKQYQPLKLLFIMFLIVKCMHPDDGDMQAPTAPANLRASNITTNSVDLQWDASTDNVGVTEYDIYKRDTLAGTTTNTAYTVGSLSAGTDYSFFVFAKDAAGNISPHSNILKVSTLSSEPVGSDQKSGSLIYTVLNETDVSVKAADTSISGHVSIPATVTLKGKRYKVTQIVKQAFYNCKFLTGIDIPNSVTSMYILAFGNCISLTSFNIPISMRIIGDFAFNGCEGLKDVYVHWSGKPSIVDIKYRSIFYYISSSAVLHIPNGMRSAYAAKGWEYDFYRVVEDQ